MLKKARTQHRRSILSRPRVNQLTWIQHGSLCNTDLFHGKWSLKLAQTCCSSAWERILQEDELDFGNDGPERALGKRMRSVTNGVHISSWISDSMADLLGEYFGSGWISNHWKAEMWRAVSNIPSERLWQVKQKSRANLLRYVNGRLAHSAPLFDSNALTIGFARRFATYKRANLLFSDHARLERLLLDKDRPIQFIFAGKAHPRDHEGKSDSGDHFVFEKAGRRWQDYFPS